MLESFYILPGKCITECFDQFFSHVYCAVKTADHI